MKKYIATVQYSVVFLFMALLNTVYAFGQEASNTVKTTTTTNTTTTEWYTAPWVWIVGGALFLILLIALIRGGSDTYRETTIVRKDVDA